MHDLVRIACPMPRPPLPVQSTSRAVARLARLRAAADELQRTHSAVSQQIRLLEVPIGLPVFDRRGRRIALNGAGTPLLRTVEPALAGDEAHAYRLVCPPELRDSPPLTAQRDRLHDELAASQRALQPAAELKPGATGPAAAVAAAPAAGTAPAGPTGSRSRAPSAARPARHAR